MICICFLGHAQEPLQKEQHWQNEQAYGASQAPVQLLLIWESITISFIESSFKTDCLIQLATFVISETFQQFFHG